MSTDRSGPTAAIALTLIAAAYAPDVPDQVVVARARREPEHQHTAELIEGDAIPAPQSTDQTPPAAPMPIGRQLIDTVEAYYQQTHAAHTAAIGSCVFPRNPALLDLTGTSA